MHDADELHVCWQRQITKDCYGWVHSPPCACVSCRELLAASLLPLLLLLLLSSTAT
jgi:hypothetical protein